MQNVLGKISFLVLFLLVYLFLGYKPVSADVNFTTTKTSINSEEELELQVDLSIQGGGNQTYYIEGAFRKEDGSNYFGLTQNNGNWVKYSSSDFSNLPLITTDSSGKWQGSLKVKIDKESSLFKGDGNYILRIKRFNASGSSSWADTIWNLLVTGSPVFSTTPPPTPTPSPISPPLSTSTPKPTSTSSSGSSFTISSVPISTNSDISFSVKVSISGFDKNAKYYLKGAFIKSGSSNYFGQTKVGNSWIANSQTYSSQFAITTDNSGNWQGNLEILPNSDDSGFTGSGNYIFKVARYTAAGSGPVWSNEATAYINSSPITFSSTVPKSSSVITSSINNPISVKLNNSNPSPSSLKTEILLPNLNTSSVSGVSTDSSQFLSDTIIKPDLQVNWWPFIGGGVFLFISIASLVKFFDKH